MKLLRYGAVGQERPGVLDNHGNIRDLSQHITDVGGAALLPENLARLQRLDITTLPLVAGQPRLGACVGNIGKFICIGLNYADHAAETGAAIPAEPVVFNKWTSAVVGPNGDLQIPKDSLKTDWEVELGGVNEVLAVMLMAAKYHLPVCPHAGGVGLCEYVQHLSMIDYLYIAGTHEGRVIEYVDHLHEHFLHPCDIRGAAYMPPRAPGYSIEMHPASIEQYRFRG